MIDKSPVTKEELRGFYSFGVAAEGFSAMAVSVFFPIILKGLGASAAFTRDDHSIPCNRTGEYKCDVPIGNSWIDTSSLVLYSTSISVVVQFFLFSMLGSLADFGPRRLSFMILFGTLTAVTGFLIVFVVDSSMYWAGFLIYILSNTFFGASFVFLFAWIPVLTQASPEVMAADADPDVSDEEYYQISDRVGNEISSKGFFYGYIAAVVELILGAGFVLYAQSESVNNFGYQDYYPMQLAVGAICIWQLVIIFGFTNRLMKSRPGPELPENENYLTFSIKNLWATCKQAPRLSELFKFLFAWFIYSDSFSTVISAAILFAQSELGADTTILLGTAIIVPLAAGLGNLLWIWIQKKYKLTTKQILIIQASLYCLLPLYGIFGYAVNPGTMFGLQNKYEIPIIGVIHGLLLGATQSSCRVMFSELLPVGHESEFFGLYEVTDKGSSWIGPLLVGAITNWTGSVRPAFSVIFCMFFFPIYLFNNLDIKKGKEQAKIFTQMEDRHNVKHLSYDFSDSMKTNKSSY